jgi:hypothetical protein
MRPFTEIVVTIQTASFTPTTVELDLEVRVESERSLDAVLPGVSG